MVIGPNEDNVFVRTKNCIKMVKMIGKESLESSESTND